MFLLIYPCFVLWMNNEEEQGSRYDAGFNPRERPPGSTSAANSYGGSAFGRRDGPSSFNRDRESSSSFSRDTRDRNGPSSYGRDRDGPSSFGRDRDGPSSFGRDRDGPSSFGRDRDGPSSYGRDRDDGSHMSRERGTILSFDSLVEKIHGNKNTFKS